MPCTRAMSVPTTLNAAGTAASRVALSAARAAPGSLCPWTAMTEATSSDCSATSSCQVGSCASCCQSASLRLAAYAASCATRAASSCAISISPSLPDRVAQAREEIADLLLIELAWIPRDGDRPLAAADVDDAVALLERLHERVEVLDCRER